MPLEECEGLSSDIDKVIDKYSEQAIGVKLKPGDKFGLSNMDLKTIDTKKLKRSIKYLLRKYNCL